MAASLDQVTGDVDILSPLANLHWDGSCCDWPGDILPTQVVLLGGKYYVGTTSGPAELYCSTTDLSSWTTLPVPGVKRFSLGTYQSQLVIVGGIHSSGQVVRDLWASEDGTKWQQSESLPPLLRACYRCTVINTGNPEYLIIAGGCNEYRALDTVCVLIEGQWFLLKHFPEPCGQISFTIYNGNLFLLRNISGSSSKCFSYYCKMASLIAACESARSGAMQSELWKALSMKGLQRSFPVSFGQQLVALVVALGHAYAEIYAFSPFTQSWVHVGNCPKNLRPMRMFVNTTGELVILGRTAGSMARKRYMVVKATLTLCPYDSDSHFSTSALSKLEAAGMEVVTLLSKNHQQLLAAIGVTDAPKHKLKMLVNHWLSGQLQNVKPTTWRSLYEVLRELGLEELREQIEDFLTSVKSLRELCTSVIMAALLQQRSLEPDQLHVRLPPHVPPTVKRNIMHHYKTITHQLPSPSRLSPRDSHSSTISQIS